MSSERLRPDAVGPSARRRSPSGQRADSPGARTHSDSRSGRLHIPSSFRTLARTHACLAAADAAMAGVLAGSLFFSLSPDAARPKVLLYQLVSVAPFAVIAPLIGPTVDRIPGGRRFVVQLTAVIRAMVYLVMAFYVDSVLLFPLVFMVMVMQKTYAVSRSALVPLVVQTERDLVEANSKLGIIGGLSAGLAIGPLGGLAKVHPLLALIPGAALFIMAALTARSLPRDPVATRPAQRQEKEELRSPNLVLAAGAMALIRASVGFLLFHLLFWLREDYGLLWVGFALSGAAAGAMIGNLFAPLLRRSAREEVMLTGALGTIALAGTLTALIGGIGSAVALALFVNFSSSVGRLAFDSLVQRSAPGANQGRAFAQFETRFQLSWVLAGVPPVLFTLPGQVGFLVVGLVAAFAMASYLIGTKAVQSGKPAPPTLSARARSGIASTATKRRERREATPPGGGRRPAPQAGSRPPDPLPPPRPSDRYGP